MLLDYETLRVIWWLLLGVLLIAFAIMDGFDLGVGALLPFVGRTDDERRVVINTIGPVWEGNQVWLVLGGGAIFAAWPALYAVSFSGFYIAMLAVLAALILRAVGFTFRSKITDPRWRSAWDWMLFVGGFVPALIFGVALGNVLQGVPFHFDDLLRPRYEGSFWALLNPFALLCGLVSVAMMVMHGASYLGVKTEGAIAQRAKAYGSLGAAALVVLFTIAGVWVAVGIEGYRITSEVVTEGPSNPTYKEVALVLGAWMDNYVTYPWMMLAPAMGYAGAVLTVLFWRMRADMLAFISSSAAVFGVVATPGVSMFPIILPSSENPAMSLTVWDSSSSQLTLFIMLVVSVIFVPLIMVYTSWVFHVLRGKLTVEDIQRDKESAY